VERENDTRRGRRKEKKGKKILIGGGNLVS
jgi:hypothetical protein